MDPLSVTLTVISLATAVKDMVELGEKIHQSFAKVSDNLRNAQRVAEDIKAMVEEIETFYESHKIALDGDDMEGFRLALQGLLGKFRGFEMSILPLIPETVASRGSFIRRWWNSKKVEERILDLQSDIDKVMRRHMMKSTMRTEVQLDTIRQATSKGLSNIHDGMAQGFEVIRKDISKLHIETAATRTHRSYEFPGTARDDEFSRNVIMFAKSTPSASAPILRTPNFITEELMTTAYIKLQINSIAVLLDKISELPAFNLSSIAPKSLMIKTFEVFTISDHVPMSITRLRHHIVRQVTAIRDLLDSEFMQAHFVHDGARALNKLSVGLKALGMDHECLLVGNWAIRLARLLVDPSVGEQPDLDADLALYLLNQSIQHRCSHDKTRSLQTIGEAYTITQNLRLRSQFRGEHDVQILYSSVLLQFAELVDTGRSIEMSIEAVQVLEGILDSHAFTLTELFDGIDINRAVSPGSSFLESLFSSAPPITAITKYAYALQSLGAHLTAIGRPKGALRLMLLGVAVRRKMVSLHGPEYKASLAGALSLLVRSGIAIHIPLQELVSTADECIQLLRELVGKNPPHYARELVLVLSEKANALARLDRGPEAIKSLEEAVTLAEQVVQDSRLCAVALGQLTDGFRRLERHDDAVRTGMLAVTTHQAATDTQAANYFCISYDLRQLQRHKESAQAAQTSVRLYRRLAMRDPRIWTSFLTAALSNQSHCLAASGNYSEALIVWEESVSMLNNFLDGHPDSESSVIDQHRATLDIHSIISYVLEDEDQCLKVGLTALQYLLRLSELYGESSDAIEHRLWNEFRYANNMFRVGRLHDVQQYVDNWIDVWISNPRTILKSRLESWHVSMINLQASVLDAQGYTEEALVVIQNVHNIVRQSARAYEPPSDPFIFSMIQEARFRLNLGDTIHAAQVAADALQLSRHIVPSVDNLLWCLYGIALTALSCQDYRYAIETAQQGCNLCADFDWQNRAEEHNACIRPSLFAILSSAQANLGWYSIAAEYACRAVKASIEIVNMRAHISATTAEQSYMETRGYLADILLATSNITQARQICEERSIYFKKRVEKRMGEYRDWAPTLRMLGVLYCSEGRHVEGDAAATELSHIIQTLGNTFPTLQEQVKIRLHHQTNVPLFKFLDGVSRKLDCAHQTGIPSLYKA